MESKLSEDCVTLFPVPQRFFFFPLALGFAPNKGRENYRFAYAIKMQGTYKTIGWEYADTTRTVRRPRVTTGVRQKPVSISHGQPFPRPRASGDFLVNSVCVYGLQDVAYATHGRKLRTGEGRGVMVETSRKRIAEQPWEDDAGASQHPGFRPESDQRA